MTDWLPWAVLVFGSMLVWSVIYLRSGDFRKATIGSLVVAKTFVAVYKLAGLDRVVFTLYLVHRKTLQVVELHVTACQLLFLSFLCALVLTVAWPVIKRHLPPEVRRAYEVYEG